MKTLLLTDVPLTDAYSGSLLTLSMCREIGASDIVCCLVKNPDIPQVSQEGYASEIVEFVKPPEFHAPGDPLWKKYAKEWWSAHVCAPRIARQVIEQARAWGAERIWCPVQGQVITSIMAYIVRHSPLPVYTQVWDVPEWWIKNTNMDTWSAGRFLKDFDLVMRSSKCIAGASHKMAERFAKRYGRPSVPFESALPVSVGKAPREPCADSEPFVIGFCGQVYASAAISALFDALAKADWKLKGHEIVFKLFGYSLEFHRHQKMNVHFKGYHAQAETIEELSQCDLLYCPYLFGDDERVVAETSFPAKLTTYMSTGVPVFFHGPAYSAPSEFLLSGDAAYQCGSLDPNDVLANLERILEDPIRYKTIAKNSRKLFAAELTTDVLSAKVKRFFA